MAEIFIQKYALLNSHKNLTNLSVSDSESEICPGLSLVKPEIYLTLVRRVHPSPIGWYLECGFCDSSFKWFGTSPQKMRGVRGHWFLEKLTWKHETWKTMKIAKPYNDWFGRWDASNFKNFQYFRTIGYFSLFIY